MLVYGSGAGALCFLLRLFGSAPEGSAFAVIIMNCAVPAIGRLDLRSSRRRALKAAFPGGEEGGKHGQD